MQKLRCWVSIAAFKIFFGIVMDTATASWTRWLLAVFVLPTATATATTTTLLFFCL